MQHRRKPASAAAPPAAKQPPARRPTARLSLAGLVVSVFLVATFLYSKDVMKAASGSSASSSGSATTTAAAEVGVSGRARSPDLRVLQDVEADALHARREAEEQEDRDHKQQQQQQQQPVGVGVVPGEELVDNTKRQQEEQTQKQPPPQAVADAAAIAGCDLYRGRWTFDAAGEQAPLYRESECEFLTEQVTCMRNGRRDDSYQKWRWQPDGCDLPRPLWEGSRRLRLFHCSSTVA